MKLHHEQSVSLGPNTTLVWGWGCDWSYCKKEDALCEVRCVAGDTVVYVPLTREQAHDLAVKYWDQIPANLQSWVVDDRWFHRKVFSPLFIPQGQETTRAIEAEALELIAWHFDHEAQALEEKAAEKRRWAVNYRKRATDSLYTELAPDFEAV